MTKGQVLMPCPFVFKSIVNENQGLRKEYARRDSANVSWENVHGFLDIHEAIV